MTTVALVAELNGKLEWTLVALDFDGSRRWAAVGGILVSSELSRKR